MIGRETTCATSSKSKHRTTGGFRSWEVLASTSSLAPPIATADAVFARAKSVPRVPDVIRNIAVNLGLNVNAPFNDGRIRAQRVTGAFLDDPDACAKVGEQTRAPRR